ncbi:HAD superfamily hydrolase (TIGR01509 family) [Nocardia tenerifensis]|uniref:HAD superfamily hydrolase (TIGR01509 family) n=1 Tax=Nocardia tenerifensis TaxID=228006 RepID=A0A318JSF9_9NOCA|nr:HAD-IA family hydrolase [Nocardia tenerifensis]PXX54920.1 HAD superfamily hydrolase (TIGR01509 family) [Nocardia tenerifensis]
MANLRAIAFDCDGVLVDSESLSAVCLNAMMAERGVLRDVPYFLDLLRGRRVAEWIREIFGLFDLDEDPARFEADYRRLVYRRYPIELQAEPGVHELLEGITAPRIVVSNAPLRKIELGLSVTKVDRYFEREPVSAYELQSWKPDPEIYRHAAAQLGYPPRECIAVEDSHAGLRAATAAGFYTVAYWRGREPDNEVRRSADRVVDGHEQLDSLVRSLLRD